MWRPFTIIMATVWRPFTIIMANVWRPFTIIMANVWRPFTIIMANVCGVPLPHGHHEVDLPFLEGLGSGLAAGGGMRGTGAALGGLGWGRGLDTLSYKQNIEIT